MADFTLYIGNKNYSSWSLRPWLALKRTGAAFDEVVIPLDEPTTKATILRHSPSGRVPALLHGELTIWDSLAICEYLAEVAPASRLWPEDADTRAVARSVSAEMHSGFHALRTEFPMDFHARSAGHIPSAQAQRDIARVTAIWRDTRHSFGASGPFLFGAFSIADAMYSPVATRFRTYGIDLGQFGDDGTAAAYSETLLAMHEMQEWGEGASRG